MGAQKSRLIETVLLSTHNICFGWEIKKIIFQYTLLSGGLVPGIYMYHFTHNKQLDRMCYVSIKELTFRSQNRILWRDTVWNDKSNVRLELIKKQCIVSPSHIPPKRGSVKLSLLCFMLCIHVVFPPQELMSQKTEKPSLSGQRLKTRKRGNYSFHF